MQLRTITWLVLLCSLLPFVMGLDQNNVIQGNTVFVNDSNVYLSATPHTISSSDEVTYTLVSKQYTGNIDVVFLFNGSTVSPSHPEIYNPTNVTVTSSYTCDQQGRTLDYGNGLVEQYSDAFFTANTTTKNFWCWQNITNNTDTWTVLLYTHHYDVAFAKNATAYWNDTSIVDYQPLGVSWNQINVAFHGMDTAYYATNLPVNANQEYIVRTHLSVPFTGQSVAGEYLLAVKPSTESMTTAISNGHLYYLDPWYDANWLYKENLTTNSSLINGTQYNYSVLVSITDPDLSAHARSDGYDILFTDNNNGKLNFSRESYDSSSGKLVATVLLPNVTNTTNTTFFMYYGNSGASDQQNATGAYDKNTQLVWQFANGTVLNGTDSSGNNHPASFYGANATTGIIDGGMNMTASANVNNTDTLTWANGRTVSIWANLTNYGTFGRGNLVGGNGGFNGLRVDDTDHKLYYVQNVNQVSNITITLNVWQYYVGTVDASGNIHLYINGVLVDAGPQTYAPAGASSDKTVMGSRDVVGWGAIGTFDDVRISNISRDSTWVQTTYNNQNDPSHFLSVGTEETNGGGSNSCTYTSGNWNILGSDACVISTTNNLAGNNITCTGTGTVSFTANQSNVQWKTAIGGCNWTTSNGAIV